ncbi:glutaredoxin 3 [Maricurvus nonylphenolicus]|uniref:glutaredoxin 3 n=1 Tax=Maricurvus nonylphenolicus TaxID=1008307 RepID=UPI0036F371C0
MAHIEIYTRPGCGYCMHAKRLLHSRGLNFDEHDVYVQPHLLSEMQARTKGRTFPQVFINGRSIGGFDDLLLLDQLGELKKRTA